MIFTVVDLPDPFGPRNPTISPGSHPEAHILNRRNRRDNVSIQMLNLEQESSCSYPM